MLCIYIYVLKEDLAITLSKNKNDYCKESDNERNLLSDDVLILGKYTQAFLNNKTQCFLRETFLED